MSHTTTADSLNLKLSNHLGIQPEVPQKKTKKQKLEIMYNAAGPILTVLRDVATLTPVPFLKEAAGLSLSLWSITDTTNDNQARFSRLRNTAVRLVVGLDASFSNGKNAKRWEEKQIADIFRTIISDLRSVTVFCEDVVRRPFVKRWLLSLTDKGKIKEYEDKFLNSVLEFQTISHVVLHESLLNLDEKSSKIITEQWKGVSKIIENENNKHNIMLAEMKITQEMILSVNKSRQAAASASHGSTPAQETRPDSRASSSSSAATPSSEASTWSYTSDTRNQHRRRSGRAQKPASAPGNPPNPSFHPPPHPSTYYPSPHPSTYPSPQPSPSPYPSYHSPSYPAQMPYNPYHFHVGSPTMYQGPIPYGYSLPPMTPGSMIQVGGGTNIMNSGNTTGNQMT